MTRRQVLVGASAVAGASTSMAAHAENLQRSGSSRGRAAAVDVTKALRAANPVPAASLAVARSTGLIWAAAYGKSDLELNVPALSAHLFRLGSVSKVLTATVAAKLASRGVLDLDSHISTWLADVPEHHRATSLRQLLTHQGGVRHFKPEDLDLTSPGGPIYMRSYPTKKEILAVFINDPLVSPPGTRVSYSTFGYTLASIAMEAAAGRSFLELIKAEIATAFGLSSLIEEDPFALIPMRANGYVAPADMGTLHPRLARSAWPRFTSGFANAPHSNPAYSFAGAGFLMTPSDAARFGAALLPSPQSRITAKERDLLFTPQAKADRSGPAMGLGWRIDVDKQQRRRWHHAGATVGGRFSLVVYPDQDLSIAIATNVMTLPGDVLGPSSDLADAFA